MKRSFFLLLTIIGFYNFSYAQSDRYTTTMKANIAQLDSIVFKNNGNELANTFTRIGDAEKTQWLPYYYAAYSIVMQALLDTDVSKKDAMAEKAKELITKAEAINGKENSETAVIKAMIATVQMTVDPQSRFMTYGALINENIQKSQTLDATNPRPFLLQAQNTFYTPEQFGGGKDAAKTYFDQAKEKFDSFKPETELSPSWGKSSLDYFLEQYK